MIGALPFNGLMQQTSHIKNMETFSISIHNTKKALAPKSTTDLIKKPLIKYHDFLNIFSQADSDVLLPHRSYDHKILLMEEKTPP